MSKYDIADAHKLKVFMQEIQTIRDKYSPGMPDYLGDIPTQIKDAIEWIAEMVEKKV